MKAKIRPGTIYLPKRRGPGSGMPSSCSAASTRSCSSMIEISIQEPGMGEVRTYTHCARCRRNFKKPKTTSLGPKCAAKVAQMAAQAAGVLR